MHGAFVRCVVAFFGSAGLVSMLAVPVPAWSDRPRVDEALLGVLDGRSYAGTFGSRDGERARPDVLIFHNGRFWSENCVPCGFQPAVYWVRREGGDIHFRGEMDSVDRGRFSYSGVVRDGRLTATIRWQKHRWYWSIDREFHFDGRLSDAPITMSVDDVARRAKLAAMESDPAGYCP